MRNPILDGLLGNIAAQRAGTSAFRIDLANPLTIPGGGPGGSPSGGGGSGGPSGGSSGGSFSAPSTGGAVSGGGKLKFENTGNL